MTISRRICCEKLVAADDLSNRGLRRFSHDGEG